MEDLPPFNEDLLLTYDTETLVHYIEASPKSKDSLSVNLLSTNFIPKGTAKTWEKDGLKAMELAQELHVRVPDIRRIVEWEGTIYVIMERIHGSNLYDYWHELGWFTTLKLTFQLRGFIHRIRSRTSLTAGALYSGEAKSVWIDDYYRLPLHASPESVAAFFNFWGNFLPPWSTDSLTYGKVYFSPDQFVFSHQDLAPRNMLIVKKNNLWLVDWDFAG